MGATDVGSGAGTDAVRCGSPVVVLVVVCLTAMGTFACSGGSTRVRPGGGEGAVGGWQDGMTGPQCGAGTGGAAVPAGGWGGGAGGSGGDAALGGVTAVPAIPPFDARLFQTPSAYQSGGAPREVISGDVNGDGAPDLVGLSGSPCGQLTVMLNQGDGQLAAPVHYEIGPRARSVRLGELNGDGRLDLAVIAFESGDVHILFGDGTGRFGFPIGYPAGTELSSLALGDVNDDGAVDVAVVNGEDDTVSVLRNDGRGAFAAPLAYPTAPFPKLAALGDLNGDGKPDLIVAADERLLRVHLNKGVGTFGVGTDYAINDDGAKGLVTAMAVADVDGNGGDDVVVANRGRREVAVFLSDEAGRLAAPTRYPSSEAQEVDIADLDGDGRPDVTIGGNSVTVLGGTGDGGFVSRGTYAVGAVSVTLADLNRDGFLDVATANGPGARWLVLMNNGDGTLAGARIPPGTSSDFPMSLSLADLNGDGRPDVAAPGPMGTVVTFLNDGTGAFPDHRDFGLADSSTKEIFVAAGDWSGDGLADLAVSTAALATGSGVIAVFRNQGNATFEAAGNYLTETGQGPVTFGDWNGDGQLDLAVANAYRASVSVFMNLGNGTFSVAEVHPVGEYPRALTVADIDGDGKSDLAVAGESCHCVSVLATKGATGAFLPAVDLPGSASASVALGDLNGDGRPDLVTGLNQRGATSLSIFLNAGDGTFASPLVQAVGSAPGPVALGDLDGDGLADIAFTGGEGIVVLRNLGGAAFALPESYALGSSAVAPGLGDLNGDGATDVVVGGRWLSVSLNVLNRR